MKKNALDQHIAALADVVPKDFVRERNALAGKLKGRDASLARAVRDLPRPSPTAWVLNQLARHHEGDLQAYLDAADELQSVQMGRTETSSLADAIRLERASRQMLVKQASGMLSAAKINVTPELRRRIADTLLAAATGPSRKDLERGLLRSDLEVTGLPDVGITTPLRVVQPRQHEVTPAKRPSPPTGQLRLVKPPEAKKERARLAQLEREAERVARAHEAEAKRDAAARRKEEAARARRVRQAEAALRSAELRLQTASEEVERRRASLAALQK